MDLRRRFVAGHLLDHANDLARLSGEILLVA